MPTIKTTKAYQLVDEQLKNVRERVETQSKDLQRKLRRKDWYRTAKRWQKDIERKAERVRVDAYHAAGIATKAEIDTLNKKLNELNRRLNA